MMAMGLQDRDHSFLDTFNTILNNYLPNHVFFSKDYEPVGNNAKHICLFLQYSVLRELLYILDAYIQFIIRVPRSTIIVHRDVVILQQEEKHVKP